MERMQADKIRLGIKSIIILFCLCGLILFGVLIADVLRNARVNILISPVGATVKIDGKFIQGSTQFYPKQHVLVEISKEGFRNKEFYIDLKANETVLIHDYLENNDGISYYQKNKDDLELLKIIQNDKTKDFLNKIEKAETIKKILPIRDEFGKDRDNTEYTEISVSKNEKCISCLKIKTNYGFNVEKIKRVFMKYGYNYDDYIIEK